MDKQALEIASLFLSTYPSNHHDDVGHWIGEHRVVHGAERCDRGCDGEPVSEWLYLFCILRWYHQLFVQVFQLIYSVRWIENFARDPHSSRPHRYCTIGNLAALAWIAHANCGIVRGQFWILWRHVLKKRVRLPAILSTCLSFLVYWAHFMGWRQRSHPLKPFDHLPQKMGKVV